MRRIARTVVVSLALVAPTLVVACRREGNQESTTTEPGEPKRGRLHRREHAQQPALPRALPLPDRPPAAVHVAAPAQVLAAIGSTNDDGRALLRRIVAEGGPRFETGLIDHLDLERAWSGALVGGQPIVALPIDRDHLGQVVNLLAGKKPSGEFGAVELARPEGELGPRLAWLDRTSSTLYLADDLPGLATGPELARAYGKHRLFATLDGEQLRSHGAPFDLGRITAEGESVADFHVRTDSATGVPGLDQISEGALTGLLTSPELLAAGTSRYAHYQQTVKKMIGDATRTVAEQNFLVRGVLEDMLKRYNAVLRSWNGRVLLGLGPQRHVALALGADDPKKATGAVAGLIDAAIDNIELARNFGIDAPRLRFKRNKANSAGVSIHVLAVEGARKQLPSEVASLVDDKGDLRIAFAGSDHAGAVMVMVGPTCDAALARWIDSTKGATAGHETKGDLVSASFAGDAESLTSLAESQSIAALFGLAPKRAPTVAVVKRAGQGFDAHVRGPAPKIVTRPRATAAERRGRMRQPVAPR